MHNTWINCLPAGVHKRSFHFADARNVTLVRNVYSLADLQSTKESFLLFSSQIIACTFACIGEEVVASEKYGIAKLNYNSMERNRSAKMVRFSYSASLAVRTNFCLPNKNEFENKTSFNFCFKDWPNQASNFENPNVRSNLRMRC